MGASAAVERVVIVGAGVAGVTTAATLRLRGYSGTVLLLDRGDFTYDRPPLSKDFLSGTSSRADISLYSPEWFAEHDIDYLPNTEVSSIDTEQLAVETAHGRMAADWIVLAMGGEAFHPDWLPRDSQRVHTLRTVGDAERLRASLTDETRLLVVGAGLLGAEIALTARTLGAIVSTVDPNPTPLADAVGSRLAAWLLDQLGVQGIAHRTVSVEKVSDMGESLQINFSDGEWQEFDHLVVAVGLEPVTNLAIAAGLTAHTGVQVDSGQRTSHPQILAVGDCAALRTESGFVSPAGHWEAAKLTGERAADNILGLDPAAHVTAWFWSDRGDLHLDVIGRLPETEQIVERGEFGSETFSLGGFSQGKLVAAASVNDPLSNRHLRKIIDRGHHITPEQFADPETMLKRIAAGD